jgi:hypothetical protein
MKGWLAAAVLSSAATVAASLWLAAPPEPGVPVVAAPVPRSPALAAAPLPKLSPVRPRPAPRLPAAAVPGETPRYSVAQAQMLMQLMAESGDPRQPAAGGLQPRTAASPAQLANPAAYVAFADQQSRAEVLAWTSGVQQIAQIRTQIEQAEQSGERSGAEIDEARGALEQLQMLQSKLQREAPELLPGAAIHASAKP